MLIGGVLSSLIPAVHTLRVLGLGQGGSQEFSVWLLRPRYLRLLATALRLSTFFFKTSLVDITAYEARLPRGPVVTYSFLLSSGARLFLFTLGVQTGLASVDSLFRNGRWLEREVAEMHAIFFTMKRDRRSLFLPTLICWAPLRKAFPTSGFYEVRLNPQEMRLYPSHISWLD